uniref:Classical MHC class I molecule, alpha-chain n=2 Tax=Oryzias latipes TaxID=8090 RepID=D5MPZ9_ORYLA|nr:classical MHC class I molecule, alpha-chain [Oryzias latipes]
MITLLLLIFVGIHRAVAVTHSLKYFYTSSSGIPNFPEYLSVGYVDDVQISHCDSITKTSVAKQEWMKKVTDEYPDYWEEETETCLEKQQAFKESIRVTKDRFNQTKGFHVFQRMYGCEWNDETKKVKGLEQFGYNGEDFLAFDLTTESWIAVKHQAFVTKQKWDHSKHIAEYEKSYLTTECVKWLQMYLRYQAKSLMKTVLPSVSLLQKSSSSAVSCHATGFYPDRAELLWRRDGEEIHEGVEKGQILPNNDGTFQMSVDLQPPSGEDMQRYECVFQLSGVKEDVITKLEKAKIRTNEDSSSQMLIIIGVLAAVIAVILSVSAFILYKKKNAKRPPSPVDNKEIQQQMLQPENPSA